MPVCCFGNKEEQNIQQVQPVQTLQSPIVQPIVMPVMCPAQPTLVPYSQQQALPQQQYQPNSYVQQVPYNSQQPPLSSMGQNYAGGYSQQPPSSMGQNYAGEYSQNTIPGSVPPINININNSQDTNSKNTRNENSTSSLQPNVVPMSANSPQPQKTIIKHIVERKPIFITKNRVKNVINTKTYYKVVKVPVQVEKDKFVYVNRFVPYNACEGATPFNVNNGFV